MTETAIRRALAKAVGIQDAHWCADGLLGSKFVGWVGPDDNTGRSVNVPDYPRSLDAMHEVEKVLTPEQLDDYSSLIEWVMGISGKSHAHRKNHAIRATAIQRAEALLRTLNLWEE